MEFVATGFMKDDAMFAATADDRRAGSPTIAWKVRPGGALAFSEPMTFTPSNGGWINMSQLQTTPWSPGESQVNRNLKTPTTAVSAAAEVDDMAKCALGKISQEHACS